MTFLVYVMTLAPGVYGFDSAELAAGVFTQGIIHPPGYPLYLLVGKLFTLLPFGDVAYRLNLMSAFFASLTVALLYHAIGNIVQNRFAAWLAAMFLGVSNYFWQMALIAEVYTPNTAFLAGDLLLLSLWQTRGSRRYLLAFSFLYGLTLTMHTSGILFAPALAWLILGTPHWKRSYWPLVGVMFTLFLVGLAPYAYLSLRASASPVIDYSSSYSGVDLTTLPGLWWMISSKAWGFLIFGYTWHEVPGEVIRFTTLLWRNYLGIGVILGVAGIAWLWRRSSAWTIGLLLAFIAYAFFVANYRVIDKDTMFLPAYVVWAVFIAAGFTAVFSFVEQSWGKDLKDLWLLRMVKVLSIVLIALGLVLNWRWVDMSEVDSYALFATEFMAVAAPQAVIIAPWSSAAVLEYYQVTEGQRPDLLIFNSSLHAVARYYELWQKGLSDAEIVQRINAEEADFVHQYIDEKTIYTVEYNPELARKFEYLPEGFIFRLASP